MLTPFFSLRPSFIFVESMLLTFHDSGGRKLYYRLYTIENRIAEQMSNIINPIIVICTYLTGYDPTAAAAASFTWKERFAKQTSSYSKASG